MLLPVTVVMAVFGVFYVLYPERLVSDRAMLVSVLLAAFASGALVYSPMSGFGARSDKAGILGSIGIGTILSAVLFLLASSGVALAISGLEKGAMALSVVTFAGFVALFIVIRATASTIGGISSGRSGKSSNIVWADRLEGIARSCGMPKLKPRILKLAGETRFLANDDGAVPVEVNQRIAGVLDTVADAVRRGDEQVAMLQLKRLRNLFSERETELMNSRIRV